MRKMRNKWYPNTSTTVLHERACRYRWRVTSILLTLKRLTNEGNEIFISDVLSKEWRYLKGLGWESIELFHARLKRMNFRQLPAILTSRPKRGVILDVKVREETCAIFTDIPRRGIPRGISPWIFTKSSILADHICLKLSHAKKFYAEFSHYTEITKLGHIKAKASCKLLKGR